jgi:hypothetical protein
MGSVSSFAPLSHHRPSFLTAMTTSMASQVQPNDPMIVEYRDDAPHSKDKNLFGPSAVEKRKQASTGSTTSSGFSFNENSIDVKEVWNTLFRPDKTPDVPVDAIKGAGFALFTLTFLLTQGNIQWSGLIAFVGAYVATRQGLLSDLIRDVGELTASVNPFASPDLIKSTNWTVVLGASSLTFLTVWLILGNQIGYAAAWAAVAAYTTWTPNIFGHVVRSVGDLTWSLARTINENNKKNLSDSTSSQFQGGSSSVKSNSNENVFEDFTRHSPLKPPSNEKRETTVDDLLFKEAQNVVEESRKARSIPSFHDIGRLEE